MKQDLLASLRAAVVALLAFTVLTGIVYPALVTGHRPGGVPHQANGSLIENGGRVVGSELIGQPFTDPGYFWSRPSALGPFPYNAMNSTGTNLGRGQPRAPRRGRRAGRRRCARRIPTTTAPVPADLVTASGSGLDPHISPAAAYYQAARVARARSYPSTTCARSIAAAHRGPDARDPGRATGQRRRGSTARSTPGPARRGRVRARERAR